MRLEAPELGGRRYIRCSVCQELAKNLARELKELREAKGTKARRSARKAAAAAAASSPALTRRVVRFCS